MTPAISTSTMDQDASAPQKQRIYIGGMDPLRGLTVGDVLRRLELRLLTEGMQLQDLHQGNCYVQFTAVCNQPPLAKIKTWFHNVTWKGCKLVVEEARPHLLQRLQEERESRNASVETVVLQPETLSRHWKVRRGHGEPVRHVDTQPCEVKDWPMLTRIRERHLTQQEKVKPHKEEIKAGIATKLAQKQSYYNRSIHLRFTDENTLPLHGASSEEQLVSIEASSASDDDDSSATASVHDDKSGGGGGKYVWSDESDDDSSDDMELKSTPTLQRVGSDGESSSSSDSDENSFQDDEIPADESSSEEEENPDAGILPLDQTQIDFKVDDDEQLENFHGVALVAGTSSHVWTDDESSMSENGISQSKRKNKSRLLQKPYNDSGEFGVAIDAANGYESLEGEEIVTIDDQEDGLRHDVESNLQVLSQIFPEFLKQQPVKTDADLVAYSQPKETTTGWGSKGQMLRFDPANPQSANQFVLQDENKVSTNDCKKSANAKSSPKQPSSSEADASSSDENDNSNSQLDVERSKIADIYEQGKLEQVFREVRESAPLIVSTKTDNSGSAFSFGFDLTENEAGKTHAAQSPGSFSFSFAVHGKSSSFEKVAGTADVQGRTNVDGDVIMDSDATSQKDPTPAYSGRRRRAFQFPEEKDLDDYVHRFFYKLNDGERIIRDLQGWRNDPAVKERWMKERFTLTQDWKRKRKYALSKKQKRLR